MTIKPLKAISIKPERTVTPQCTAVIPADTRFEQWRKERYRQLRPAMDPDRCQRESVVELDGKPYCRLHAGGIALQLWINGALVKKESV